MKKILAKLILLLAIIGVLILGINNFGLNRESSSFSRLKNRNVSLSSSMYLYPGEVAASSNYATVCMYISWSFTTSPSNPIKVFAVDSTNWALFNSGHTAYGTLLSTGYDSDSGNFYPTYDDTWYIAFCNYLVSSSFTVNYYTSLHLIQYAPTAPRFLVATGYPSYIFLTWSAPSSDGNSPITKYQVYRGTSSGSETYLCDSTTTHYIDSAISSGTTYYYFIYAVNAIGTSPGSYEAFASESLTAKIPTAPLSLSGTASNSSVSLSWSTPYVDGGSSILHYDILRGNSSGGEIVLGSTGATSYNDTGLTNGVRYYYVIKAVNAIGSSPSSNEISAMPLSVPTAPLSFVGTGYPDCFYLAWAAPAKNGGSAIITYYIYRGISSNGETYLASVSGSSNLRYKDTSVVNGTTYYYRVAAINAVGTSANSTEFSGMLAFTPSTPFAPQSPVGIWHPIYILLSWTLPYITGGATIIRYDIFRGTSSSTEVYLNSSTGLSYNDYAIAPGTEYYYMIRAVNSVGPGPNSTEISTLACTVPSVPQNFHVSSVSGTRIYLTWIAPSSNGGTPITGYKIYMSNATGKEILIESVSGYALSTYIDVSFKATTYYPDTFFFVMSGVNAAGTGMNSSEVLTKVCTVSSAPQSLVAQVVSTTVTLTWSAPKSNGFLPVLRYEIYRSELSGMEVYVGNTTSTSYSDTTVEDGITYFYLVKCVNSIGISNSSNEVLAIIPSQASTPGYSSEFLTISVVIAVICTGWQEMNRKKRHFSIRF